jgi:hypothetical protein
MHVNPLELVRETDANAPVFGVGGDACLSFES